MKKAAYLLFLIGSTVLVSFQGKAVSYLLFYFALLLPLLALLYSAYVYYRFKIVQDVSPCGKRRESTLPPYSRQ